MSNGITDPVPEKAPTRQAFYEETFRIGEGHTAERMKKALAEIPAGALITSVEPIELYNGLENDYEYDITLRWPA